MWKLLVKPLKNKNMQNEKPFFGLDFGTTNSALSININGEVKLLDIDKFNLAGKTLRSILFFNKDGQPFVGQEAINQYIEHGATGRIMQSIKTFLPHRSFTHTDVFGKKYELEDLIAVILKHIKKAGEEEIGFVVDSVVMGRPAVFSEDEEDDTLAQIRLENAARKAGFKYIYFQFEPIAAALTFESSLKKGEEKKVFVGDFGGGTSDFTVIKARGGAQKTTDRKKDVLSMGGVYIGGDAFDSRIMWDKVAKYFGKNAKHKSMSGQWLDMPLSVMRTLCKWHLIPDLREKEYRQIINDIKVTVDDKKVIQNLEDLIDGNYGLMLFQAIEQAKCELSLYDKSQINYERNETDPAKKSEAGLRIKEDITRSEFESVISRDVEKIEACVDSTLKAAKLREQDIDFVFLTGGTSYIPRVRKIFTDKFGREKIKEKDAFTSVAYGLGLSGYLE